MKKSLHTFTRQEREDFWKQLIGEWYSSGKKEISSFCRDKKIAVSSFYQWRGRFNPDFHIKQQKPVKKTDVTTEHGIFVPVKIQRHDTYVSLDKKGEGIILYYPNGCYLRLSKDCDPQVISWLNKAMGV